MRTDDDDDIAATVSDQGSTTLRRKRSRCEVPDRDPKKSRTFEYTIGENTVVRFSGETYELLMSDGFDPRELETLDVSPVFSATPVERAEKTDEKKEEEDAKNQKK